MATKVVTAGDLLVENTNLRLKVAQMQSEIGSLRAAILLALGTTDVEWARTLLRKTIMETTP